MNVTRIRSRRNDKGARLVLSALLTVSMLFGSVPNGALKAMADELEPTPVEEVVPSTEDQATLPAEGETPVDDAEDEGEAAEVAEGELAEGEELAADAIMPLAAAAPDGGGLLGNPMPGPSEDGLVHAWSDPDTRTTVDTNAMGLTINLFNYDVNDLRPITNKYDNDHTDGSSGTNGDGTDSGINAGKNKANQLKFYATGDGVRTSPAQYASNTNPGNTINQFTGVGNITGGQWDSFYTLQYANQGIVKAVLSGSDTDDPATRFPVLNTNASDKSTNYLFDTNGSAAKTVYSGVNNLFYLKDAGASDEMLVYDSNASYAYYDVSQGDGGDFVVYDGTYDRSGGSKSGMKVGFFPFNEFAEPGATPCINPNEGEWVNGEMDHHLGLTLNVPFVVPYNGEIHRDNGEDTPMVFEFSGDDDMWVFIDGKLVLDIGGIHQPISGSIDFKEGVIRLGQGTANPPVDKNGNPVIQGGYSYSAIGIDDANNPGWQLARGDVVYLYTENGHEGILGPRDSAANRAGTSHTLQAFYLERGGCDSNLMISTNIHLMTKKKVTVSKEWAEGTLPEEKNRVKVQLICKGVGREDPRHVEYAVINEAELEDGSWSKTWEDLPTEGYNASGVYDETPGATNTYCDYSYLVREVPVYGFEDTYTNATTSAGITVEEVTFTEGGEVITVNAAPVSTDYDPVEITNTPIRTSVAAEKVWSDGAEHHTGENVYVQLQKTVEGETSNVGDPVKLEANTDPAKSWKHTFTDLVLLHEGDTYNVIEGAMESGSFVPYTDDPFIIGDTVYRRTSVKYYDKDGSEIAGATSLDGSVAPYAGKVEITNEPVEAKVNIKKVDAKDQTVVLEGVKFVIYKDNGNGTYNKDEDNTYAFGTETASTFITGPDGTVQVSGLRPGGSWKGVYWFVETETQDAYILRDPNHPIKVIVDNDGNVTTERDVAYDTDESAPSLPADKDNDGAQTLTVPNTPAYALPAAGGPGAYPYLFAGAFVAAFALASEDNKRRMMGLFSAGARR